LVEDHRLRSAPGDQVAGRMLGGVEDDVCDDVRFVDRRQVNRLDTELGATLTNKGVFMVPGSTWVTLMGNPSCLSSTRRVSRKPSMPCLAAA
jgi:hypothetical protein